MATETQSSGGNGFLYFIVGALLIAVIGIGVWLYSGGGHVATSPTDRAISQVGNAAEKVGDSAQRATQPAKPPG
jgi:hypothetical protein